MGVPSATGRTLAPGETVPVSIRQHEISILTAAPAEAANVLRAIVGRQVFLGSARDYTVALDDKTELRVTAPPEQNIVSGQQVWLKLPAARCRALMGASGT